MGSARCERGWQAVPVAHCRAEARWLATLSEGRLHVLTPSCLDVLHVAHQHSLIKMRVVRREEPSHLAGSKADSLNEVGRTKGQEERDGVLLTQGHLIMQITGKPLNLLLCKTRAFSFLSKQ